VVNSFMTEAGLLAIWAWCDKRAGIAALVPAPDPAPELAGKGAITTLTAEGGICACRSDFKTAGGKACWAEGVCASACGPSALVLQIAANKASRQRKNRGLCARFKVMPQV
jgi:hypothetical protein